MVICTGRFECANMRDCVHNIPHSPVDCQDGKLCSDFRSQCGQINRVVRCVELPNNQKLRRSRNTQQPLPRHGYAAAVCQYRFCHFNLQEVGVKTIDEYNEKVKT